MRKQASCYMCDAPETSREHAPPLCLFPQFKEFGRNLRRNLITVPSCDAHNSAKSKDDEFFRAVLLMQSAESSDVARHLFFNKLRRAAGRRPAAHGAFFRDHGTVDAGTLRALEIDARRFVACVDRLARALFFD